MEKNDYIYGLRAVIEAIESGKQIDKVLIKKDLSGELSGELMAKIKEYGIVSRRVPVEKINRITHKNHQGVIAFLSAVTYDRLEFLVPRLYEEGKNPMLLVLDGLTDIRNFGAIGRTADCAGFDGIVIPCNGSVSVTPDAMKTSAGALLYVPVCRERDTLSAIRFLKDNGYRIIGASEKGAVNYTECDYRDPVAIVMGSEETGISENVLRQCDELACIPILGNIESLNVSVAAGVLMYEAVRQRKEAE